MVSRLGWAGDDESGVGRGRKFVRVGKLGRGE